MVTFEEGVGRLMVISGQSPEINEAVLVICREYDRMYQALDHFAGQADPDISSVARIALRRQDPGVQTEEGA